MNVTTQFAAGYRRFCTSEARRYKYRVNRETTIDDRFRTCYHELQIRTGNLQSELPYRVLNRFSINFGINEFGINGLYSILNFLLYPTVFRSTGEVRYPYFSRHAITSAVDVRDLQKSRIFRTNSRASSSFVGYVSSRRGMSLLRMMYLASSFVRAHPMQPNE